MDLTQWEWTCACCGRRKRGVPDFGFDAPIHHQWALDGDPEFRIVARDTDLCEMEIAGQDCFFIRCVLRLPVEGAPQGLGFGVWASLSAASFARYRDSFGDAGQSRIGPMFGYLANRLPAYPDTLNLKADVLPQDANQRPLLRLWDEAAEHPLYADQTKGLDAARLEAPQPGWLILTAHLDGAFAGFFAAGPDPDDPARDLIDNLHVMPEVRGRGVGATLMREGADRLAALGRGPAILRVVESNAGARAFYRDHGGREGTPAPRDIGGGRPVVLVPYHWDRHLDIAAAARRRLARRNALPMALEAVAVDSVSGPQSGADHPVEAGAGVRPRRKQRLGDAFGLSDYGVNRVELDPGVWSSIPHFHSREDEFVFVIEGELTLVSGDETRTLRPGDCAGFPAGLDRPHHLENRSAGRAVYLEVGSRRPDADECDYPGEDLRIAQRADGSRGYVRRDGSPLTPD